jgi:hypothetical protein
VSSNKRDIEDILTQLDKRVQTITEACMKTESDESTKRLEELIG